MPDYAQTPPRGSISVEDAIAAGKASIAGPVFWITVAGCVLAAIFLFTGYLWWIGLLLLFATFVARFFFKEYAVPRWRIWAYEAVADIHDLQQRAEEAGLLPCGAHLSIYGNLTAAQHDQLQALVLRFNEPQVFDDDPALGFVTEVFRTRLIVETGPREPALKLSSQGIGTADYGFFPWEQISSESIGIVRGGGYRTRSTSLLYDHTAEVFRFWLSGGVIVAYPMEELRVRTEELRHALYIYRGRWVLEKLAGIEATAGSSAEGATQTDVKQIG